MDIFKKKKKDLRTSKDSNFLAYYSVSHEFNAHEFFFSLFFFDNIDNDILFFITDNIDNILIIFFDNDI